MWFDGITAGWLGGIIGASMGVIFAPIIGICARKGKCRWFVLGLLKLMMGFSLLLLLTGGVALFSGQPKHVWYSFAYIGFILTFISPIVYIGVKERYTLLELKKININDMK